MLTILEKIDALRRVELLREIRTESLARIASIAEEKNPAAKDTLYVENQFAERIFAIVDGEVVLRRNDMEPRQVRGGSILGILPALAEGTYDETATAAPGTRVLQIEQHDLIDLMASDFHMTCGLVRGLVRLLGERG